MLVQKQIVTHIKKETKIFKKWIDSRLFIDLQNHSSILSLDKALAMDIVDTSLEMCIANMYVF